MLGLPRSRTAWLSQFLSYRDWFCAHEQLRYMRNLDDVKSWLSQPKTGTSETAAAPFWRLILKYAPETKFVIIRRPVHEVVESLMNVELFDEPKYDRSVLYENISRLDAKLEQIEHRAQHMISLRYDDLKRLPVCEQIFEYCLPYKFDEDWWIWLDSNNVQCSVTALNRYHTAYKPQLDKLAKTAKHAMIAEMSRKFSAVPENMIIQEEPFETFLRDGVQLFAEHAIAVGEAPDSYLSKNLPLMRELNQKGNFRVITARSNGRMFGYLMTIIGPSLESENIISAVPNGFFASKDAPGLGIKLQRAAINMMELKGATEVFYRAGSRGDGSRMSSLYKRLGAQFDGEIYRLSLAG